MTKKKDAAEDFISRLKKINISEIKPYKLNAKQHPQSQIDGIAESMRRFGITQPAVVDRDGTLVIGHERIEAAKLVGFETFPVLFKDELTEQEIKALRLIDNRISETGWDQDILKLDLEEIDFDFESFNINFDSEFSSEKIDFEKEWDGMPKFEQKDLNGISLIVHFETEEHKLEFSKLINQNVTDKTKYVWWPEKKIDKTADIGFINEA